MSPDGTWMLKRPYFVVRDNSKESTPRGHGLDLPPWKGAYSCVHSQVPKV